MKNSKNKSKYMEMKMFVKKQADVIIKSNTT